MREWLRKNKALAFVSAALVLSIALLLGGMIRYRVPHILWRTIYRWKNVVPDIPLDKAYARPSPKPALTFSLEKVGQRGLPDWQERGRRKLRELLRVPLPTSRPSVTKIREETVGSLMRETLVLTMDDGTEVPAFLFRHKSPERRPGIVVVPGHSRGIVATAGIVEDFQHANARVIAEAGYVTLTVEVRGFGYLGRMGILPESVDLWGHTAYSLVAGRTAIGRTVADLAGALNYFVDRPEVDDGRIGVVGFSSGGKAAIYWSALDERLQAVVASGCASAHDANFLISGHDSYEAVPGLAAWLAMSDCLGLIAPRPLLVHWGELDHHLTSRAAGANDSSLSEFAKAQTIYGLFGTTATIERVVTPGIAHQFDNVAALTFLRQHLPIEK